MNNLNISITRLLLVILGSMFILIGGFFLIGSIYFYLSQTQLKINILIPYFSISFFHFIIGYLFRNNNLEISIFLHSPVKSLFNKI